MPTAYETFSERLLLLRNRHRMTQIELAARTGIAASTISDYELEKFNGPGVEELRTLCNFFHVSADFMIGRSPYEHGLSPDQFVVDLDVFEQRPEDATWSVKVPRRAEIVDHARHVEMKADVAKRVAQRAKAPQESPPDGNLQNPPQP